jgi:hypothetical protein
MRKTAKYVLDHPEIRGLRLIHGVVSHAPHFVPLDHAWVELPGDVVFDGVVQTFFTRSSYYSVMAAAALDAYSAAATRRLVATYGCPGPWNAKWVPTAVQLEAYAAVVRTLQDTLAACSLSVNVGRNRYPRPGTVAMKRGCRQLSWSRARKLRIWRSTTLLSAT